MNLRERKTEFNTTDWTWVKGAATIHSGDPWTSATLVEYEFYGLHYLPNGTYGLYGMPEGRRVDIRQIPKLWPGAENVTSRIVLAELEKELKTQEDTLLLSEVYDEGMSLQEQD